MALPKLETPTFTVVVPSTKKPVDIRPFLVKEEKVLMMAQESKDIKQVLKAIKTILVSCSEGELDPKKLTTYDIEYLFLQLRAISVGETAELKVKCSTSGEEETVEVNLKEIEVTFPEKVDNNIPLNKGVGITLKPISLEDVEAAGDSTDIIDTISLTIDTIYDEDEVYPAKDSSKKELKEFVESLSHSHLEKIQEYISSQPKLRHEVSWTSSKGHPNTLVLEGLQSFFM